ncbi:MAG: hypothetical protein RBQ72_08445 [Desulfobacterium sp.]|jgi:hypothetical protein|nr:hypothetical protein [Desulfobacterium sp.]
MGFEVKRLFFDKRDLDLIRIVNAVYDEGNSLGYTAKLFYQYFHPFGIKELAESKGLRIANSVVHLLQSMERGDGEYRLQALKGLKDEILNTAEGSLPKNTARVLLQIMKDLVRARGDKFRQLELAHAFRTAASGKPRIIRGHLKAYHLLEMPEAWNQITFDDHVHDANTKGRKSPTHLIMDAWIKGIRRLRVIYYHYVEPRFVYELVEAAEIMDIDLRIGIEFSARFRDRYITFIWVSRGLPDIQSFLCFLAEPHVIEFMEKGKEALKFQTRYILKVLEAFNDDQRLLLNRTFGIQLAPLDTVEFLKFVGPGQASMLHLGEYIHLHLMSLMKLKVKELSRTYGAADDSEKEKIKVLVKAMDGLSTGDIVESYLKPENFPDLPNPWTINEHSDDEGVPDRLRLRFDQLLEEIIELHPSFRITLNLDNLRAEDVLELLYDSEGLISRLEIFNLKEYVTGNSDHIPAISELQQAINEASILKLKRVVRQIIGQMKSQKYKDEADRTRKLIGILHDIYTFRTMYRTTRLRSRIGSDSTGRSFQTYGMGLGIIETLPLQARREIGRKSCTRLIIPFNMRTCLRVTTIPSETAGTLVRWLRKIPGLERLGARKKSDWIVEEHTARMTPKGNIVTLGGIQKDITNGLSLDTETTHQEKDYERSWENLNSKLKNTLKVLIGFIPAFACFALTKDWWFLAYFGAFIWFGITGLRNIIQSVLGGGGINRSHLLRWNDYVSWDRMTDSLLFTGFSVPLLDYFVKTLLLDKGFGINVASNPAALYSIMALTNGIYLSTHNAFRGLPRGAIMGNFFRSVISIPIAILFSAITGGILGAAGVVGVESVLQKWAAIISKAASDLAAGVIEGSADRFHNVALRTRDYKKKFKELFDSYSRLELLFPDTCELTILEEPEKLIKSTNGEVRDLVTVIIINSLDMLYFWMYQPRARITAMEMVARFTPEEKRIFMLSQKILEQEQHISRLLVDGILGRNFSKPLSFYLMGYQEYLVAIKNLEE